MVSSYRRLRLLKPPGLTCQLLSLLRPARRAHDSRERPTFALTIFYVFGLFLWRSNAQNLRPPTIQFTNATKSAGIEFKHFKGNKGVSINREEFGPGVCG